MPDDLLLANTLFTSSCCVIAAILILIITYIAIWIGQNYIEPTMLNNAIVKSRYEIKGSDGKPETLEYKLIANNYYLRTDMDKSLFSQLAGIENDVLDIVLASEAKMSFDDYINFVRLKKLREKMDAKEEKSTEEDIVACSGFPSIEALDKALLKHEGISLEDWMLLRKSFIFYK